METLTDLMAHIEPEAEVQLPDLHRAALEGDHQRLKMLIQTGRSINSLTNK